MISPTHCHLLLRGLAAAILWCAALFGAGVPASGRLLSAQLPDHSRQSASGREATNEIEPVLEGGRSIERELSGGDLHSYLLRVEAGEFLRIIVEQKGIDVAVTLRRPDGGEVFQADTDDNAFGVEQTFLVGDVGGAYVFELRPSNKNAKTGRYVLRIDERRTGTAQDQVRIQAQKILLEAVKLQSSGTATSMLQAAEKYRSSLQTWSNLNEQRAKALTLERLGVVGYFTGKTEEALESWTRELTIREALGDRARTGGALADIGLIYNLKGESPKALQLYGRALAIQRQVGDREGEATTLNNTGSLYQSLGDRQKALENYSQSLAIHRQTGDRAGEAIALNNTGSLYNSLGNASEALRAHSQALKIRREVGDRRGEATSLSNTGLVYSRLGDKQRALEYYEQSVLIRRAVGDRSGEANSLNNIGGIYSSLGDKRKALAYYEQSLKIRREIGARSDEANSLRNIGAICNSLGEHQKALDLLGRALQIEREIGGRNGEALALSNIGLVYSSLKDARRALEFYNQALALFRDLEDYADEAVVLSRIATVELENGRVLAARNHIEAALSLVESLRTSITGFNLRSSYSGSVHEYYEFYIDLLTRLHRMYPAEGFDRRALEASERSRARSLLEMLSEARADIRQGVAPDLIARERSLLELISGKYERIIRMAGRKSTQQQASDARAEIEQLTTEFQQVQAEIKRQSPHYAAITQPDALTVQEIQQQVVDRETILLEYALGDERSFLWAVTPTGLFSFELPKRAVITAAAERFYGILRARGELTRGETGAQKNERIRRADAAYPAAAAALSRMLLGPVMSHLMNKRLVIVSDVALQYIPFAALPSPGAAGTARTRPLVLNHEIIQLPSASTLVLLRKELAGRAPAPKTVAVLADPVFEPTDLRVTREPGAGDTTKAGPDTSQARYLLTRALEELDLLFNGELSIPRLPYSKIEADAITILVPEGQRRVIVGFAANHEAAIDPELQNYRILHFATHSLLNSKQPDLSGLLLSLVDDQGKPQERGMLSLGEIYNLKLPAELVVLSACRTALGKEVKGEGLVGLTRGFMYAGVARVVASLWKADDEATAELMARMYQGMLGKRRLRPSEALRRAQIGMYLSRSRWSAPYYWAAFTLQGEWKPWPSE